MRLPPEKPATWAAGTPTARSSAAASSAKSGTEKSSGGIGDRPAPRLSKAVSSVAVGEPIELWGPRLGGVAQPGDEQDVGSRSPVGRPRARRRRSKRVRWCRPFVHRSQSLQPFLVRAARRRGECRLVLPGALLRRRGRIGRARRRSTDA